MARKILLADDSVTAQNMGRKILSDAGYNVVTVNNGSAALKRVGEQKPDLIVLDVYMPGYSGLEVCQRLKESQETARIPVLLTVGKLEPFKPEEARRVRADAFIIKPFEASELLSAVTRLEDQVVPEPGDGGRPTSRTATVERFQSEPAGWPSRKTRNTRGDPATEVEADTSWKSRLRFPSKKKKEEIEESEPEVPAFKDLEQAKAAAEKAARAAARGNEGAAHPQPASVAAPEARVEPDIPRDITPEELDALSAVAAKLDGAQAAPAAAESPAAETKAVVEDKAPEPAVAEANATEGQTNAEPVDAAKVAEEQPVVGETIAPQPTVHVETLAVEPAPVDREDEPLFAQAVELTPQVAPAEPVKDELSAAAIAASAEEKKDTTQVAQTTAADDQTQGAAPSEKELEEALRLLTPSLGHAGSAAPAEQQAPQATEAAKEATPEVVAERASELAASAPSLDGSARWVAEAVALSPEEAALSLEAEMFRTLSPQPALAEVQVAEPPSPVASEEAEAVVEEPKPTPAQEEQLVEETPVEESAAVTFADAVRQAEPVAESAGSGETEAATPVPAVEVAAHAEQVQPAMAETMAGGEEAMGKNAKDRGGKSNWHQIRTTPAAAIDAVEAAKQAAAVVAEEAPKAMAAAAGTQSADPDAIASIVDSVLADLRPKIVEEIAKKLGKK